MRKSKALASIVLGAFLSLPSPAYSRDEKAGTADPLACQTDKECFEAGSRAYAEKAYLAAAELFKKSYALTEDKKASSILLYNIAKAYENSRNFDLAGTYYEAYIKEMPAAKDKLVVEKRLRFLEFYAKGRELCQKGEHAEGIKYMREAESFFAPDEQISTFLKEDMSGCRSAETKSAPETEPENTPGLQPKRPVPSKTQKKPEAAQKTEVSLPEVHSDTTIGEVVKDDRQPSFWDRYTLPLISGGIAGVLGATGVAFNSLAGNKFTDLKETCAPDCSDGEVNGLENMVKARNAAYVGSIAALAVTAAFLAWKLMDDTSPQVKPQVDIQSGSSSLSIDF